MINNATKFITETTLNSNPHKTKNSWRNAIVFAFILIIGFVHRTAIAQVPTTCFEIQSILVAACGTPEGENEMVRFIVGPNALPLPLLTVSWPNTNNSFLGICQNAQTASNVAAINASLNNSCGFVQEPVGGVLPAGSTVILVTSTNMNPSFNSFAGLTDTLIMIFQCSGNTSGHFKNYGTTGTLTRTLIMTFDACSDTVTYHIDSLTTQAGLIGDENGATVVFDFPGNATYQNPGCEAPFNSLFATLSTDSASLCAGASVSISAMISNNNFTSYYWTGGAGTYGNSAALNTTYQTNITFHGTDSLTFVIVGNCNDTSYNTLNITINPCTIGIQESFNESIITVFPNPASDECVVNANKIINASLSVYDMMGRKLSTQSFSGHSTINLVPLQSGMYVLEIRDMESISSNNTRQIRFAKW